MDHKEFDKLLRDVEVRLERLRALYEQWFQGVERIEPMIPAKELERRMRYLRKVQPQVRNTALRFRFQTLWQRYTTLQTYWKRVARQIEEGTYRRDVMRARARREEQRRQREDVRAQARSWELDLDIDVDEALEEAEKSAEALEDRSTTPPSPKPGSSAPVPEASRPPRSFVSPFSRTPGSKAPASSQAGSKPASPPIPRPPAGAKPPPPPPAARKGAPGPGEDRIRALYDQYLEARKRNNERTDNVRYETVAKNIRAMVPQLERKHKSKDIDFEVVVQNGRVGLKPVPKK